MENYVYHWEALKKSYKGQLNKKYWFLIRNSENNYSKLKSQLWQALTIEFSYFKWEIDISRLIVLYILFKELSNDIHGFPIKWFWKSIFSEPWSEPSYDIKLGSLRPRPTANRAADIDFLNDNNMQINFKGSILMIKMGCNNPSRAPRLCSHTFDIDLRYYFDQCALFCIYQNWNSFATHLTIAILHSNRYEFESFRCLNILVSSANNNVVLLKSSISLIYRVVFFMFCFVLYNFESP